MDPPGPDLEDSGPPEGPQTPYSFIYIHIRERGEALIKSTLTRHNYTHLQQQPALQEACCNHKRTYNVEDGLLP